MKPQQSVEDKVTPAGSGKIHGGKTNLEKAGFGNEYVQTSATFFL